jgi:hypothetical protein
VSALAAELPQAGTDGLLPDEQRFWDAAFLAVFEKSLTVQGWTLRGEPVTQTTNRVELCGLWADYAIRERRNRQTSGV